MLTPDKIKETFVKVDDFCKEFDLGIANHRLDAGHYQVRNRKAALCNSGLITILIAFHSGHFEALLPGLYLPLLQRTAFPVWSLITVSWSCSKEWLCR